MEPTTAALIFLLCSQIQNTGAVPVRHDLTDYKASGNGEQGSFVKVTVAALTGNENPPCQIFPVTDDPSLRITTTPPPPVSTVCEQQITTPAPTIKNQGQDTHQKPPPLHPNVIYQPIIPYYVLPPNPASGESHEFGRGGGLPQAPSGAPRWLLDLLRNKQLTVGTFPQSSRNPTGNERGGGSDSTSSKMSSEEDSDSDGD